MPPNPRGADPRLEQARSLAASGQVLRAELLLRAIVQENPGHGVALRGLASLARARDDVDQALSWLERAHAQGVLDAQAALEWAQCLMLQREPVQALGRLLQAARECAVDDHTPWLWLLAGDLRDQAGDAAGALRARFRAIRTAQARGLWRNAASTPPELRDVLPRIMQAVRQQRADHLRAVVDDSRAAFGSQALRRVDRAVDVYLEEAVAAPPHPSQRPKVLYFPDLPCEPYLDPALHPWSGPLQQAWVEIRDEALGLLSAGGGFEDFMGIDDAAARQRYVAGTGPAPAWDAFFFYRHGKRYDDHHRRCPVISAAIEAADLCRIGGQAPEVCLSLLAPGSHILPHHGVTNVRSVLHLPLIVPPDCALHIVGVGEHAWQEGRLMMFDDTFEHEAWNRSDGQRLILLMDCWNPHLDAAEREAMRRFFEAVTVLEMTD